MGSRKGRGNQYIEFARVVYCKLPTNGKQLPAFPLKDVTGIEPWPQIWEAKVLPLCHRGPQFVADNICHCLFEINYKIYKATATAVISRLRVSNNGELKEI